MIGKKWIVSGMQKGGLVPSLLDFQAQLAGRPKNNADSADIDPARFWGSQSAYFRFVQPEMSSGTHPTRFDGEFNVRLGFSVFGN